VIIAALNSITDIYAEVRKKQLYENAAFCVEMLDRNVYESVKVVGNKTAS